MELTEVAIHLATIHRLKSLYLTYSELEALLYALILVRRKIQRQKGATK